MKDYETITTSTSQKEFDEFIMKRCLQLAEKGLGFTKTNPLVGCVITRERKILAQGYHRFFGGLHAERDAICQAEKKHLSLKGATLYVNLEPCCHFGKQPPCTDAIIEQKISRVVIGMEDPNPKVSGNGIQKLKEAGVTVDVGILETECRHFNAPFLQFIQTQLPYCIGKVAMSLDGKIATSKGQSQWISCRESRNHSHLLRSSVDAILVGIHTVLSDNPSLNCRFGQKMKDPIRIVADSQLRIPLHSKILHLPSEAPTLLLTTRPREEKRKQLEKLPNVKIILCKEKQGHVDMKDALKQLAKENMGRILVEGGAEIHGTFLREQLYQKMIFYLSPRIIGAKGKAFFENFNVENLIDTPKLTNIKMTTLGEDFLMEGHCVYRNY